jgi:uncharacterized protein (TIGR02265 family)
LAEQVVFEQTIEGLFVKALGSRLTPRAKERLRGAGVDLSKPLLPAYSFEIWMSSLKIAAEEVFGTHSQDEAMLKLGELLIDGYKETFLGRAVLGFVRVLGPRRTLGRSTQNFRSGNNYTETRVTDLSPTCTELWMNEVGPYPTFTQGILLAALRASGAQNLEVVVSQFDGHACTYRVSWNA